MTYITSLGQFLFYFKYLWSPADFEQLQTWLQNLTLSLGQGGFGNGVLAGLDVTAGINMSINVSAGVALSTTPQLLPNNGTINAVIPAPVSNPRWDLIVLRPKIVDTDLIPEPINPSNPVPLHELFEFDVIDIAGVESVTPAYPAKQANDVILSGLKLTAGQTNMSKSNVDYTVRELPNKKVHPVKLVTASYNILSTDDTIEADATLANQTHILPPAYTVFGQDFLVSKIDNSANLVTVSGSDPISGQGSVVLDTQWQSSHVRSVGTGWRVL